MSEPTPNSTADWRKYPRSPGFLNVVIGSAVAIILLLTAAYFLLRADSSKMLPHAPPPNPNSQVQPLLPSAPATFAA